jgi:hypothetical protein
MAFSQLFDFTEAAIQRFAPIEAGVYCLYSYGTVIYYGRAQGGSVTIESRLYDHKAGRSGPCTQSATHFSFEKTTSPVTRERELLEQYRVFYGQLPRCNEVMP